MDEQIDIQIDKKFESSINDFVENLRVEKNASKHTIRNYKNDLVSFGM